MSEEYFKKEIEKYKEIISEAESEAQDLEDQIADIRKEIAEYPLRARTNFYLQVVEERIGFVNQNQNLFKRADVENFMKSVSSLGGKENQSLPLENTLPGFSDRITNKELQDKFKVSYEKDLILFQQMQEKNEKGFDKNETENNRIHEISPSKFLKKENQNSFFITEVQKSGQANKLKSPKLEICDHSQMLQISSFRSREQQTEEIESKIADEKVITVRSGKTITEVDDTINIDSANYQELCNNANLSRNQGQSQNQNERRLENFVRKSQRLSQYFNNQNALGQAFEPANPSKFKPKSSEFQILEKHSGNENQQSRLNSQSGSHSDMFISDFSVTNTQDNQNAFVRPDEVSLVKTDFYVIKERAAEELKGFVEQPEVSGKLNFNTLFLPEDAPIQSELLGRERSGDHSPGKNETNKKPSLILNASDNRVNSLSRGSSIKKPRPNSNIKLNFDNYQFYKVKESIFVEQNFEVKNSQYFIEEDADNDNSQTNFLEKNKEVLNKFDEFLKKRKGLCDVRNSFDPLKFGNQESQTSSEQMVFSKHTKEREQIFKNSDTKCSDSRQILRYKY